MDPERCIVCNKKVKIYVIKCRCKKPLCHLHVASEHHQCTFDYREHGRQILEKQNPRIVPDKI